LIISGDDISIMKESYSDEPVMDTNNPPRVLKFYLFKTAWMFMLIFAINVVFYRANGISISKITILDVIWAVVAFLAEIPTGILADRWSRKYMLVLSGCLASIGFLIFSVSSSYFPFIVAISFLALRSSFESGTFNALLYDTLKETGHENRYEKVLGRCNFLGVLSVITAGIIGSYLAKGDIRLPFFLSIFSCPGRCNSVYFQRTENTHRK